jgi:uncharacterized protein with beta-barrel porin domain
MAVRIKRGLSTSVSALTFQEGELVFSTDNKKVFIGDGTTVGGIKIFEELFTSAHKTALEFVTVTGAVDLDDVNTKALSALQVTDIVNTLTSTSETAPLSASQGKVLKDLIDGMANGLSYTGAFDASTGTLPSDINQGDF